MGIMSDKFAWQEDDFEIVTKKYDPDQARDEEGRWTDGGGEQREGHESQKYSHSKVDPTTLIVAAMEKEIAGSGLKVKAGKWSKVSGWEVRGINVENADGTGYAQLALWRERHREDGTHSYRAQQQDMSLPEAERGKGTGGKMVAAMVAGYKVLGVKQVPIHNNTNPEFWDHMGQKYPGQYAKYSPDQERDERGRWTSGGGSSDESAITARWMSAVEAIARGKWSGKGSDAGLRDYVESASKQGSPVDKFVLDHGQGYPVGTFTKTGGPNQCYMNAAQEAIGNPDLTYVEGYVSVLGVPIEHAWNLDKQGKVIDPTIRDSTSVRGYFGVPIQQEFLMKELYQNKVYGILTGQKVNPRALHRVITTPPAKVVQK